MEERAPTPPLLTTAELKAWLNVSQRWVRDRLEESEFVEKCVVDLAPDGSPKRTLRYNPRAVAEYVGIPAEAPTTAA